VNYVSNPDAAEGVAADICASGTEAIAIHADVANEAEVREIFAKAITRLGTIDILVNNAVLQRDARVPFDVPRQEVHRVAAAERWADESRHWVRLSNAQENHR